MPASLKNFLERVRRSQLVEPIKLDNALSAMPIEDMDAIAVAKQLIRESLLTKWQCQQLLDGRYKGFFLGKYKLLDQLGVGGMSMVYIAEHTGMRRKVALKVLPKSRVNDKSFLERFCLEAQASAALNHPNIVRAFDFDSQEDTYYLVMEYVEGKDLRKIVSEDGPLAFDRAAQLFIQAAQGLHHAHEADMVHRDVKPANLLVDQNDHLRILDLGLALFSQGETSSVTLAHDEKVLGTADYFAPEQALDSHDVDSRADIYALGGTLHYALTGVPPYPDGSIASKVAQHQTAPPPDPRNRREDCPESLADICTAMMQKEPDARIQTASEVAVALKSWLANPAKAFKKTSGSPEDTLGFATEATGTHVVTEAPKLNTGSDAATSETPKNRSTAKSLKSSKTKSSKTKAPNKTRSRRKKRGLPAWLWVSMLWLVAAAIWMAIKLADRPMP